MIETLIDVRELPEFANGHIAGAIHIPLASLDAASSTWDRAQPILLVCESGRRAEQARLQLRKKQFTSLSVLPGGMAAWRAAGKPLVVAGRRPWSMERQVRTAAGSLVTATLALGFFVSPYFLLGTAFVGLGLIFAGVSNTCAMGSVLGRMPWNRAAKFVS